MKGSEAYVEVVYFHPQDGVFSEVVAFAGLSVGAIISKSGLLIRRPELDFSINKVGIFGVLCSLNAIPKAGDRIEIYCPLIADSKERRKKKAKAKRLGG